MICPACERKLNELTVSDIKVDVCDNGCRGIWFDLFELQKVDETHESAGESLLDIARDPKIKITMKRKRICPRCKDQIMLRHFTSVKREIEVDECPKCGGFWLDYGELNQIRKQFKSDDERRAAAQKYFQEVCGPELEKMHKESEEKMKRAQKIARMFRFICPSYYIPGDQDWGAF